MNSNLINSIGVALETGNILEASKLIKENEELQTNFSDDVISSDIIDKEIEDCNGVNYFIDNLPEAIPCFTPDEMEKLGVFDQDADNNYFNAESTKESYEWFLDYKATGNPGMDWYGKLRKAYDEYMIDKSDKNKQRVLELGWNPYINLNEENLKSVSRTIGVKLAEAYSCQVIDLSHINEEDLVDTAEDELKGWANHLFNVATSINDINFGRIYKKEFFGDNGELYFLSYYTDNKDNIPVLIQKLNNELLAQNVVAYRVRDDYKEDENTDAVYIAIDLNIQTGDLPIVQESDDTADAKAREDLILVYNSLVATGQLTGDEEIDYWNNIENVDLNTESSILEGASIDDRIKDKEHISKPSNIKRLINDIKFNKKTSNTDKAKQMRLLTYNLVEATTFSVIPFGFVWKFVYESFFILMGKNKKKEIEKLDEKIDLQTEVLEDKIKIEAEEAKLKIYHTNLGALKDLKTYIKGSLESLKKKFVKEASEANKGLQPVFIVTSFTNTAFGKVIKTFTHDTYSHASMGLDSKLDKLYTFAIGNSMNGFGVESIEGYLKRYEDAIIHVSAVFIKPEDHQTLRQKIDYYVYNMQKTTYNAFNCVRLVLGKESEKVRNDLSMICSQFVDNMMKFISVDLTNKPSNLVTPADLHRVKNPKVFKLYEGKVKDYDYKAINKKVNYILNKKHSVAIKESRLLGLLIPSVVFESKEFPVQFDEEGNLLIQKKRELDYLKEYQNSKKLHKSYKKYNNLEGMKYEAAKLWYLNTVIMSRIENETITPEEGEKLKDARSKILTEFSLYMNDIQKIDGNFNFQFYYNSTPFSDDKIKVKKSTIKYSIELVKSMAKHILL